MIFLCIHIASIVVYFGDEVLHTAEVSVRNICVWKRSKKMYISTKKILFGE